MIERGHCGPARIGYVEWHGKKISLPTLLQLDEESDSPGGYSILDIWDGRSHDTSVHPLSEGIFTEIVTPPNTDLYLLPSLPGVSALREETGHAILRRQLELLRENENDLNPKRAVVRLPDRVSLEDLSEALSSFKSLGVRAASLTLDGTFGPSDMNAIRLRHVLPLNWTYLALGRIEPSHIPLLYYLGFDILDTGLSYRAAATDVRLWRDGIENMTEKHISPRYCTCDSCKGANLAEMPKSARYDIIAGHNHATYRAVLSEARHAMETGHLRALVEAMTHRSPALASALRRIDADLYEFLEAFTPTAGDQVLPLIGPESYNAPAVRRFRERLVDRYVPPPRKKLVLVLPCSARKPYSESRSHHLFDRAISSGVGGARREVSEAILTSPLGVIPRELERIFPIANYDIPVTGDWDAEELRLAAGALVEHLSKYPEDAVVVAHVSGGYRQVMSEAEDRIVQTLIYTDSAESATSRDALSSLESTLTDMRDVIPLESGPQVAREEALRATADFQFGRGTGQLLIPEGANLRGKLFHLVVCELEGVQLCSFVGKNGLLSLTLEGGEILQKTGRYWVRFDGRRIRGGSLFAVGISDADPFIRPGDEVVVVNGDEEVVGVGKSEMSGREMCAFDNGRAISLRHTLE
jgi:archaeosine synthase